MSTLEYRRRWRRHYLVIAVIYCLTLLGFQALRIAFSQGFVEVGEANLLAGGLFYSLNGGLLLTAWSLTKLYIRYAREYCPKG